MTVGLLRLPDWYCLKRNVQSCRSDSEIAVAKGRLLAELTAPSPGFQAIRTL